MFRFWGRRSSLHGLIFRHDVRTAPDVPESGRLASATDIQFTLLPLPMENTMRKVIVAACCAAFIGSISVASAQTTTGPQGQQSMKSNDNMNSMAKMKKKKKGMMKSGDGMSGGGMSKGGMDKGGMDKGGMSK
jgi:pentapeptide MXKDX repeat protein